MAHVVQGPDASLIPVQSACTPVQNAVNARTPRVRPNANATDEGMSYVRPGAGIERDGSSLSVSRVQSFDHVTLENATVHGHVSSEPQPTEAQHLVNKTYVDMLRYLTVGSGLMLSGGRLSLAANQFFSRVSVATPPTSASHLANKAYVDAMAPAPTILLSLSFTDHLARDRVQLCEPGNPSATSSFTTEAGALRIIFRACGLTGPPSDNRFVVQQQVAGSLQLVSSTVFGGTDGGTGAGYATYVSPWLPGPFDANAVWILVVSTLGKLRVGPRHLQFVENYLPTNNR